MKPFMEQNLCFKGAKEDGFQVSDLVWGKVKGYPWWPGQIVEPLAASAIAKKEKDSYLIAYFGDESVLWSEAANIKPFVMHFSRMSKESSDEAFSQAVDAATEEYSRRIQAGLACPCLPEDAVGKVKLQGLTDSGSGGGSFASAFQPQDIATYLNTLAKSPQDGCDALKFVTAKAQLLAFYRRRGHNIENFDLGDDTGLHASLQEEDVDQVIYKKRKSPSTDLDQPEPLGENLLEPDSQEEPAYSVPVRRGRGHPRKAVVEKAEPLGKAKKLDFISGGQKMKAAVLEEQHTQAQLEEMETFFLKREAELIEKGKAMEDRERSVESREERVERRENEVVSKQENLEKWDHHLNAKQDMLISRESQLDAYAHKLEKLRLELKSRRKMKSIPKTAANKRMKLG